jgi:hypothetical protein
MYKDNQFSWQSFYQAPKAKIVSSCFHAQETSMVPLLPIDVDPEHDLPQDGLTVLF